MELKFTIPGEPRGKGRPRFSRTGHAYTDSETKAYEDKVVCCYRLAHRGFRFPDTAFLCVDITAYLPIPQSASEVRKAAMEAHHVLPSRKPDVDNIEKIILDALNGIAYHDDARVHRISCAKYYGSAPRVEVTIKDVQTGG